MHGARASGGGSSPETEMFAQRRSDRNDETLPRLARDETDLVALEVDLIPGEEREVAEALPCVEPELDERAPLVVREREDRAELVERERATLERRLSLRSLHPLSGVVDDQLVATRALKIIFATLSAEFVVADELTASCASRNAAISARVISSSDAFARSPRNASSFSSATR